GVDLPQRRRIEAKFYQRVTTLAAQENVGTGEEFGKPLFPGRALDVEENVPFSPADVQPDRAGPVAVRRLDFDYIRALFGQNLSGHRASDDVREFNHAYAFQRTVARLSESPFLCVAVLCKLDQRTRCGGLSLRMRSPFFRRSHHSEWKTQGVSFIFQLLG